MCGLSSNRNIAATSPRSAAAVANLPAIVDLPVPAAPTRSVLLTAAAYHEVVKSAAKGDPTVLDHAHPAALRAVFGIGLVEGNHSMRDALNLQVVVGLR